MSEFLKKLNLNSSKMMFFCLAVGFVIGVIVCMDADRAEEIEGNLGNVAAVVVTSLFLTLLNSFRSHDQHGSWLETSALGVVPSLLLGSAGGMIFAAGGSWMWWWIWGVSTIMFAIFWTLPSMSFEQQMGTTAMLSPLPSNAPALSELCATLRTPLHATPGIVARPGLADQLICEWQHSYPGFEKTLETAMEWLKNKNEEAGIDAGYLEVFRLAIQAEFKARPHLALQRSKFLLEGETSASLVATAGRKAGRGRLQGG